MLLDIIYMKLIYKHRDIEFIRCKKEFYTFMNTMYLHF